jgi:hypothetical protein
VLLLLFDAGLAEQNPRFILPALPPVAILAGLGVATIGARLPGQWHAIALVPLGAALLLVATLGVREMATLNRERLGDLQVAAWTAAHVPRSATVLSFGITLTLQHSTHLRVLELYTESRRALIDAAAHRHPLYLLVQPSVMTGQFAARSPGESYRYLRSHYPTMTVGTLHGYTLTRVGST